MSSCAATPMAGWLIIGTMLITFSLFFAQRTIEGVFADDSTWSERFMYIMFILVPIFVGTFALGFGMGDIGYPEALAMAGLTTGIMTLAYYLMAVVEARNNPNLIVPGFSHY